MKVLVTGFNPFDGHTINPSWEAVKELPKQIAGADIVKYKLPTEFNASSNMMKTALAKEKPDFVICVGQAAGRDGITIERVAINVEDARIPDNAGFQPYDYKVHMNAPTAYLSTLPIKDMVKDIKEAGYKASISNTAGTFVCNTVMFTALHYANQYKPKPKCGFIHVPLCTTQSTPFNDALPKMELADIVKCLEIAIKSAIENC